MSEIKSFLAKIFRGKRLFTPLEKVILTEIRSKLDIKIVDLWDQQVESINNIQRLPENVETNFYRIVNGKPSYNPKIAFQDKPEEWLMAELTIRSSPNEQELNVEVWFINGQLFSLEYKGGVRYFEEIISDDNNNNLHIDVTLH